MFQFGIKNLALECIFINSWTLIIDFNIKGMKKAPKKNMSMQNLLLSIKTSTD